MAIEVSFGFPADGGSEVEPLFADDFESYTVGDGIFGGGANGFSWSPGNYTTVRNEQAFSGTKSLWFPYGPTEPNGDPHWWSEQRFSHPPTQQAWYEFYLRIPDNFVHPRPSASNNNKFFAWWGPDGYSTPGGGIYQFWSSSVSGVISHINCARRGPGDPHALYVGPNSPFITEDMLGKWHRIRIHIRLSDFGQENGIQRLWVNDNFLLDITGDRLGANTPESNWLTSGYLMGYDNSGYPYQVDFYLDDFKIYMSDPGWL